MSLTCGSLFSGAGLGDLGLSWAGFEHRWFSEIDPYCSEVLLRHWPEVPNHGDIKHINWDEVEPVDVVAGGFPCQSHSLAGNRKGIEDERWLWDYFAACVRAIRPRYVIIENVPGLLSSSDGAAIRAVFRDLAEGGYDARWQMLRASDFGAPHKRERIVIVAYCNGRGCDHGSNPEGGCLRSPIGEPAGEIEQRGGWQHRSGSGRGDVADPGCAERRTGNPHGRDDQPELGHGVHAGRSQGADGVGERREAERLVNTERGGQQEQGLSVRQPRQDETAPSASGSSKGNHQSTDPTEQLADAGEQRRQQDTGGAPRHEVADEGRTKEGDHQPQCGHEILSRELADPQRVPESGQGHGAVQDTLAGEGGTRLGCVHGSSDTREFFTPIPRGGGKYNVWQDWRPVSAVRRASDGSELGVVTRLVPPDCSPLEPRGRLRRKDMLKALGNGIVPSMFWYVGDCIMAHAKEHGHV